MKLYFGNSVTASTTIMILALLGFIGYNVINSSYVRFWGRRSMFLFIFGLVVCCFAATRDGLDKTIQNTIDGSCAPGIFSLVNIPTIVGAVGAFLIVLAAIATPIAKSQYTRQIWFYIMSGGTLLKILTMEILRIIIH